MYSSEIAVDMERPRLDAEKAALIVVDMVQGQTRRDVGKGRYANSTNTLNEYYYKRVESTVVPNLLKLMKAFRNVARPVVHVRYRSDHPLATDWPLGHRYDALKRGVVPASPGMIDSVWETGFEPTPGEIALDKRSISVFNSTNIADILHSMGVQNLVIAGVATPYGVGHAALDATDRNFFVTIPVDCVAGMSEESENSWLNWASQFYVRLSDASSLERELSESS